MLSAHDSLTGRLIHQEERLDTPGDYYASTVGGAGRVYLLSEQGMLTVIDATSDSPRIPGRHNLGERATATPPLSSDGLIVRTATLLRCFRNRNTPSKGN